MRSCTEHRSLTEIGRQPLDISGQPLSNSPTSVRARLSSSALGHQTFRTRHGDGESWLLVEIEAFLARLRSEMLE
ncbi:hypothetical protein B7760_05939 (plasmid) [Burkholderia glumae]|nr:hypothetical protein B7760_05939 [Burkholderia glumae]